MVTKYQPKNKLPPRQLVMRSEVKGRNVLLTLACGHTKIMSHLPKTPDTYCLKCEEVQQP